MSEERTPLSYEAWRSMPVKWLPDGLDIGGWPVMQRWETPLMHRLAREVVASPVADILEVGFGMGISASAITELGCRSYTVIEAHPEVAERARVWADRQPVPVPVIEGFWQDAVPRLEQTFDGILFDTFPLTEQEMGRNHYEFIPIAGGLLRPAGRYVAYSDETSQFRSEHLHLLLAHFAEVRLIKVTGLAPPADCGYWRHDEMVIPVASVAA